MKHTTFQPSLDDSSVPTWICDAEGRIASRNGAATKLLGLPPDPSTEVRSYEWISPPDAGPGHVGCPFLTSLREGTPMSGRTMRVRKGEREGARILVMPTPLRAEDGTTWVLFTAEGVDRWTRIEQYIHTVASRSNSFPLEEDPKLTPREKEILALLATDRHASAIAREVGVSYATVRNHIQNILRKVGGHSIQEAVARFLLQAV